MRDLFIGGAWTTASGSGTRDIRCPADGSLVATVDEAGPEDAAAAIAAAREAFDRGTPTGGQPVGPRGPGPQDRAG